MFFYKIFKYDLWTHNFVFNVLSKFTQASIIRWVWQTNLKPILVFTKINSRCGPGVLYWKTLCVWYHPCLSQKLFEFGSEVFWNWTDIVSVVSFLKLFLFSLWFDSNPTGSSHKFFFCDYPSVSWSLKTPVNWQITLTAGSLS